MILVTVGTSELPFDRLTRAADELAAASQEQWLIQTGHSKYEPRSASWFRFGSPEHMQRLIAQADLVVCHGGFAIISECLRAKKRIVACPRREELGEAVNPQHELVDYLASLGVLIAVRDETDLGLAITKARCMRMAEIQLQNKIPQLVESFVKAQLAVPSGGK